MKHKIYKFKKGDLVPDWVIGVSTTEDSVIGNKYFGCNGRMIFQQNGISLLWVTKHRNKNAAVIRMDGYHNCNIHTDKVMVFTSAKSMRRSTGLKSKRKAERLPRYQPVFAM